jgi:hypothetical protein
MPYTIAFRGDRDPAKVRAWILAALESSPFTATLEIAPGPTRAYSGSLIVKPVRLRESKLYCGQHPGECLVGAKRRSRCLEWDDWVAFHAVVNDVLDARKVDADAWTNPMEALDKGKKMWIRRGLARRERYDWFDDPKDVHGGVFRNVRRIWNHGSADQFASADRYDAIDDMQSTVNGM